MYTSCPVCHSKDIFPLVSIKDMPIYCNVLHKSSDEAVATRKGDIDLVFCKACTHIYNSTFDPEKMDYSVEYENSLHYSAVFNEFSNGLAKDLVEKHQLNGKNIVEIGCGKGDFLKSVCSLGNNTGFGFDRSYDYDRADQEQDQNVNFYQEFYSQDYSHIPADMLCCRHVLEHIEYPVDFLRDVTTVASSINNPSIYFEVPNGLFTLRDFGVWDIIYAHCAYFTPLSLSVAFEKAGCSVDSISETFQAQFLSLEGSRDGSQEQHFSSRFDQKYRADLFALAESFSSSYQALQDKWNEFLGQLEDGKKVVIWGTGSKGVTFLNVFSGLGKIEYAVDLNPHKHGMYVPGGAQQVVAPDMMKEYQPDYVIVMNPVYRDEIAQALEKMNVSAEVLVV